MMTGMLVAGIGCLLAGVLAIGFGIPINEFGLGNTLILAGAGGACTGFIILSLWVVVRELRGIAERLGAVVALDDRRASLSQPLAAPLPRPTAEGGAMPYADRATSNHGAAEVAGPPPVPPAPRSEDAPGRDRFRAEMPSAPESDPAAKPRRNLLFSSSRRERERAQSRAGEPPVIEPRSTAASPGSGSNEPQPATFEDAWPKPERARSTDAPPQRRTARTPLAFGEPPAARQPQGAEDQSSVTVLKSGVVDGMAYSLYSDGSIEAQMPEGLMRFASIEELRAHLDQRP
jgi:hypothetical protein